MLEGLGQRTLPCSPVSACLPRSQDTGGTRFPVLKFRVIARNYVRTWFLVDLLAALPFDRMAGSGNTVAVRVPGLLKAVRLFKLKRVMRKLNGSSFGPVVKVTTPRLR